MESDKPAENPSPDVAGNSTKASVEVGSNTRTLNASDRV
jgi:hypothetical protein